MSNLFTVSIGDFWITIQCLQNPTIDRWYESAKLIYRDTANLKTLQNPVINGMKSSCVVKPYYDKILRTLDELRSMGLDLPEEPGEFNFDQQWCNRVHRYFTTLCITKGKMDFKSSFLLRPLGNPPSPCFWAKNAAEITRINVKIEYFILL